MKENGRVYIRSAPSKSAEIIRNTDSGEIVTSEGTLETGDGYKWIKLDGSPHYMVLYNTREYTMRKMSLTAEKAQYVVGGDGGWKVYIRSAPSKSAKIVGNTDPGDIVTSEGTVETGDGNKWIKLDGNPSSYMMFYDSQMGVLMTKK